MKRNGKKWIALGMASVLCMGMLTGCGKEEEAVTPTSAPTVVTPVTSPTAAPTSDPSGDEDSKSELSITKGVFSCAADSSHEVLFRFKEDGTFYANDLMMQKAYQGRYEVVDRAVPYYDSGADAVMNWKIDDKGEFILDENGLKIFNPEEDDTEGLVSEKAVVFYEMDGTTPFIVADGQHYRASDLNVIAYADGKLHNLLLGGYTRTLTQNTDRVFTESDEIRNLLYTYMPEELPKWAADFNASSDVKLTVQDLPIRIYHNGYDNLAADFENESGTYTYDEEKGVYTFSSGATLTVNGENATYAKGSLTIALVPFKEAGEAEKTTIQYAFEGSVFSGAVTLTAYLYSDGTCEVSGRGQVIDTGTWESGAGLPSVTMQKGKAKVSATSATDVSFVYTGDIGTGADADYTMAMIDVPVEKEAEYTFTGSAFSGAVALTCVLYNDGTVEFIGRDQVIDTGTWEKGAGFPKVTMEKGSVKIFATSAADVTLTYTGDIGTGAAADYELKLAAEKEAEYTFTGSAFSGAVALTCVLYNDGTVEFIGRDQVVDTGTWEKGAGFPKVTMEKGSVKISATSAADVTLTYTGDIGTGAAADYELKLGTQEANAGDQPNGNAEEYSFTLIEKRADSVLEGKNLCILGSSVVYGTASNESSIGEYLAARLGCNLTKEAVSGTTLVDDGEDSYIKRMINNLDPNADYDVFICQLSTNDATKGLPLGKVAEGKNMEDFDTSTVIGAMEYIICYATETWGCPVAFFTGSYYDSIAEYYGPMVDALSKLQDKWGIGVLDLWNNEEFNNITEEERALYMADGIHPKKAGYRDWWGPELEKQLLDFLAR